MTDSIKAYAIHTIKLGSGSVSASTKDSPSVFEVDADTFKRLEGLQAARRATKEEIAIWKSQQDEVDGTAVAEPQTDTGERKPATAVQPESGADNDPKSRPAGKAKTAKAAEKADGKSDDDLGV